MPLIQQFLSNKLYYYSVMDCKIIIAPHTIKISMLPIILIIILALQLTNSHIMTRAWKLFIKLIAILL